jgi:hypothetical protein
VNHVPGSGFDTEELQESDDPCGRCRAWGGGGLGHDRDEKSIGVQDEIHFRAGGGVPEIDVGVDATPPRAFTSSAWTAWEMMCWDRPICLLVYFIKTV